MKNSKAFFLVGAAILFLWIIGGFNPWISWEQRLLKIVIVGILTWVAWILKNSKKKGRRTTGLIVVLLIATGAAFAEPYASHLLFDHHHHTFDFVKGKNHYHYSTCGK